MLGEYIDISKIEQVKILSSGIAEASKISVIEVEFNSVNKLIDNLTYEDEKNPELVFGRLSEENETSWIELNNIKSIICELVQFFTFNLHLNFLTYDYQFSFTDKPNLIGFIVVSENDKYYYETDKLELLSHYILYSTEQDNLMNLMRATSKFWCLDIPSIHFFLDALKSNHITSTNFIKLVFTIESFFSKDTSNDFMSLTIPLILSEDISKMKENRLTLKKCFSLRNNIVHGNEIYNLQGYSNKRTTEKDIVELFFELKNIIIHIFYFYINRDLYCRPQNVKINHELIFELFPNGIIQTKQKKTN